MLATSAPPLLHRYFFALKSDMMMARRTHIFAEAELGEKGLLEPERLHVTLGITPDFQEEPSAIRDALIHAGAAIRAAPFAFTLDRLVGGAHTVALRPGRVVPALRDLQKAIAAAMATRNVAMRPDWTFSPHETLAYRKGAPFQRRIEGFRWIVNDFCLVHSVVGLHRHETIGQWQLVAPEEAQGRLF